MKEGLFSPAHIIFVLLAIALLVGIIRQFRK
jgi:hypothetical protein